MSDEKKQGSDPQRTYVENKSKKIENFTLNYNPDEDEGDEIVFPDDEEDDLIETDYPDEEEYLPSRKSESEQRNSEREEERRRRKALKDERRRKKKKAKQNGCVFRVIWFVLVLILGVFLAEFMLVGINDLLGRNRSEEEEKIVVKIPADANVDAVASLLANNGVISSEKYFKLYAKMTKDDDLMFTQGSYELSNSMDYEAIINYLQSNANRVDTVELRFPEGMTVLEIADKLAENKVCDKDEFLELCNSDQFDEDFTFLNSGRPKVSQTYYKLEGYLFPDTYEFYQGESATTTIYRFLNNYEVRMYYTKQRIEVKQEEQVDEGPKPKLDEDGDIMYDEDGNVIYETDTDKKKTIKYEKLTIEEQAAKQGMTMDELLVLASMIQSEAANAEDMKNVSSVFHNRLNTLKNDGYSSFGEYIKGNLDSDPTIFYPYKKSTAPKDFDGKYDTYKSSGLPAGSVCNPGMDAIKAALYPNDTNYYYFCHKSATEDSEAKAYYASTSGDHNYNLALAGLLD